MTDFGWLLEDGGVWLLEDNTGKWLLEEQEVHGIEVSGTQSQELIQRKITKFLPTDDLIINICAGLITNVGVRIPAFGQKLLPMGLFSEKLRRSFVIPTASLKLKLKEYLLKEVKIIKFQDFCDKYGEVGRLLYLKELMKKWKK